MCTYSEINTRVTASMYLFLFDESQSTHNSEYYSGTCYTTQLKMKSTCAIRKHTHLQWTLRRSNNSSDFSLERKKERLTKLEMNFPEKLIDNFVASIRYLSRRVTLPKKTGKKIKKKKTKCHSRRNVQSVASSRYVASAKNQNRW